ncbi:hypothetical protein ACYSNM_09440 [Myroides sp. LJL116]
MDSLCCKECDESILLERAEKNNGFCDSCFEQRYPVYFDCKINVLHRKGIFNCGSCWKAFMVDFATHTQTFFTEDSKEYSILDLSQNAKFVATLVNTFTAKDRYLKIIDVATRQVVFQTNAFFTYEVLFTSVEDIIICRAAIKKSKTEKTFVFNFKTQEILYTFPVGKPLEYGNVNFENHTFTFSSFKTKGTFITIDLKSLETTTTFIESCNVIQRIYRLNNKTCFIIDSKYNIMRLKDNEIVWRTKLDLGQALHYAPEFLIHQNKIIFTTPNYKAKQSNIEKDHRYFFSILMEDGHLELIQIPLAAKIGKIMPFLENSAIDNFGNIFNFDTKLLSKFPIEEYCP